MDCNTSYFTDQSLITKSNRLEKFFDSFNLKTILNRSRIRKSKGYSSKDILFDILILPFMVKNLYHDIINNSHSPYGKDAVYELLKCE